MQLAQVPTISDRDMEKLASYNWPGNARELRNILERAVMLSKGSKLQVEIPSQTVTAGRQWMHEVRFPDNNSMPDTIEEVTRALCAEALRRAGGSKKEAALLLGISRQSLYRYMTGQDGLIETATV